MEITAENVREYADLFGIPISTLRTWIARGNREHYLDLLSSARKAIEVIPSHKDLLTSKDSVCKIAKGLGNESLELPALDRMTLSRWKKERGKRKQLIGFYIGYQFQQLEDASSLLRLGSTAMLIAILGRKRISLSEFFKIYRYSPTTTIKFLKE